MNTSTAVPKLETTQAVFFIGLLVISAILMLSLWILISWSMSHSVKALVFAFGMTVTSWLFLWSYLVKFFLVGVPANVGLVTKDQFDGCLRVYRQGLHIIFPWEVFTLEHFMSAKTITVPINESFPTKDGGVVVITGSFQYRPALEPRDNETLEEVDSRFLQYFLAERDMAVIGFYNHIVSLLRGQITTRTVIALRDQLDRVGSDVEKKMGKSQRIRGLEKEYGVNFLNLEVATLFFDKETQNAISAGFSSEELARSTKAFMQMSPEDRQDALVLAGKAQKDIKVFKFEGIDPEIARALIEGIALATRMAGLKESRDREPKSLALPDPPNLGGPAGGK